MSPVFVKEFLEKNKCSQCPQTATNGRTMCRKHRIVVNDAHLIWSHYRRESGLCINCVDGKEVLTKDGRHTGRCKVHRKMNQVKCRNYTRTNYQACKDRGNRQIDAWRKIGRCGNCVQHNPLEGDAVLCSYCHEMQLARAKGDTATVKRLLEERQRVRAQRRLEAIKVARERLQNFGYKPPTPAWSRKKTSKIIKATV